MGSPYPLMSLFAVYLWIVFKVGPEFMKNRKPFNLSNVTRIYNLFQVIGCLYLVTKAHDYGFSFKYGWTCLGSPKAADKIPNNMMEIYNLYWFFILLRSSEFMETIIFVLRKKQNQVSLLHVYHHIAVVALLWIFLKYSSGLMELFIGLLNSCVHVVMYSYYFLSSFESLKKLTSNVKQVITTIQIVQLVVLFGHCLMALASDCGATKMYFLQTANIAFLIVMFLKFYGKSYSTTGRNIKRA